jgi:dihydroorotate dehydrogenase (fumarate)
MPAPERRAIDLGTTIAGVRFPFCAMNASGAASSTASELRALARSATGAIVLKSATVHPLVHPEYRTLHNPGFDKLVPLVRELVGIAACPVIASIAGATADEYGVLARAFGEAGAALIEANLADPYVAAALAPWEERGALRAVLQRLATATTVPAAVKLPERIGFPYADLGRELREAGVRVVVVRNEFAGLDKLLLEGGGGLEIIAVGGVQSGYDVSRALAKGAKAVQVGSALVNEGPGIFARLAREMRIARGERP